MALKDINAVKRNIIKLRDAGAPDSDIDQYVQEEGYTPEQIIGNVAPVQPMQQQRIGIGEGIKAAGGIMAGDIAGEIPKAGRTLSAIGQMPYTIGKDIYETGKGIVQTIQGKQTPQQLGQRLTAGISGGAKGIIEPIIHPKKYLSEEGALASFLQWVPAAKGVSVVGKAAVNLGEKVTLKSLSSAYGVPETFVKERLMRSKEIQSALPREEMANKLIQVSDDLNTKISELNALGKEQLSPIPDIPTNTIVGRVRSARSVFGKQVTSKNAKIINELDTISENLKSFGPKISEVELKDIIQKIDDSIEWGKEGAGKYNEVLEGLRKSIDAPLKEKNPMYAKTMKPEAELIGLNSKLRKNFGLSKDEVPGNTTLDKINQAANPKNIQTRETLKKISDYVGEDLYQQIKDTNVKHQFEIARPQGAKRTLIGSGVGTGIGLIGEGIGLPRGVATGAGTTLGTLAGMTMDTGGPALAKLIDKWASMRGVPKQNYSKGRMLKPLK